MAHLPGASLVLEEELMSHAGSKATEAAAPEATETATAAPTPIAGTPMHGY
jgi:hypothetical protein